MPSSLQENNFGNLQAYKFHIRPAAHRFLGLSAQKKSKTKHQQNVLKLLKILMLTGSGTTWDMAKTVMLNDVAKTRTREKEYRRLLIGRVDRGRHSEGVLQLGLVVKDGQSFKRAPADKYRLSLHGILCCLEVLDPSNKEIDILASKYTKILPKVFGKWDSLKSLVGNDVSNLKILSKGLLLDDQKSAEFSSFPFHELMLYLNIKYQKNLENITEEELANQISYWFFTSLLYNPKLPRNKKKKTLGLKKLMNIFRDDPELAKWYLLFFNEVTAFYKEGLQILNLTTIFPKSLKKWSQHSL